MAKDKTTVKVKREPYSVIGRAVPIREAIRPVGNEMDRLIGDFDWPDLRFAVPIKAAMPPQARPAFGFAIPPVDLVARNDGYELHAELPGLTLDQIEVKLFSGMVTIKVEKSSEYVDDEDDYHLCERSFGSFQRCFRVPSDVEVDKIEAHFDKGVLKVILPKSAAAIQDDRKIDVKAP